MILIICFSIQLKDCFEMVISVLVIFGGMFDSNNKDIFVVILGIGLVLGVGVQLLDKMENLLSLYMVFVVYMFMSGIIINDLQFGVCYIQIGGMVFVGLVNVVFIFIIVYN